ncbi:helix-turn-helix domain-containing protein [Arthrobacter sp. GMC3]|uniref:helix-turn-helix domain-containing protein n=1 Tax=Arthrobacter sp. GMC3 TaxID=2058894 RepID=UPI0015E29681|nr:helix-turn-helix transcriptional regulator [Arthrobacter sp. GMC3]
MGSGFGERLRQERLERTLTQGELGGALYSASYISLLESGHREPTVEIIKALSQQLQLSSHTLHAWAQTASPQECEYLVASLNAWQCWDTRDFLGAAHNAENAAIKASSSMDAVMWWNMTYLQATALLRNSDLTEAVDILSRLLEHPLTAECDSLNLRARQVMAAALLGMGRLNDAILHASLAVEIGAGASEEQAAAYLIALQTLIGALAESGQLEEAWNYCLTLNDVLTEATPAQTAGEMHWVIGNVAFFRNDVTQGIHHHSLASRLLSPAQDLARWAQFNKATAWVRLAAGVVEKDTLQAIERSELAHSVVGASATESLEVSLLRARWLYLNRELPKALDLLTIVNAQKEHLGSHTAGDTALLLGQVLKAMDRTDDALLAFADAKTLFTEAGAGDRISQALDSIVELSSSRQAPDAP